MVLRMKKIISLSNLLLANKTQNMEERV